jgi:hypothetical protein
MLLSNSGERGRSPTFAPPVFRGTNEGNGWEMNIRCGCRWGSRNTWDIWNIWTGWRVVKHFCDDCRDDDLNWRVFERWWNLRSYAIEWISRCTSCRKNEPVIMNGRLDLASIKNRSPSRNIWNFGSILAGWRVMKFFCQDQHNGCSHARLAFSSENKSISERFWFELQTLWISMSQIKIKSCPGTRSRSRGDVGQLPILFLSRQLISEFVS